MSDLNIDLMKCGRIQCQKAEETRKDFNIVLIHQDKKFFLRALQGHSGRNHIDPSLQDHVLIPNDFFECIYHMGCAIKLHSILNSGLMPGGQNLSKRQTVFFTSVDPMNKEHLGAPRLESVEETSKHCVLGRHKTCSKERIYFLSNTIERNHPLRNAPS